MGQEPIEYEFSCTEADYPRFKAQFPDEWPQTEHREFLAAVESRIAAAREWVTRVATIVGYEEFQRFCAERQEQPSIELLWRCAWHVWARNLRADAGSAS